MRISIFSICAITSALALSSCNNAPAPAPKTEEVKPSKPNVLLIVADDLGYSDISPFGGNINTPVLEAFAKQSLRFSDYHVLPTCSPTRCALLSGNDNHVAGFGIMNELDYPAVHNLPGYSGHLTDQVMTIPEVLRQNGYHTYMTGKWHLGEGAGQNPFDRGFEETFILGTGGGSHWADKKALAPPQHMEYSRNGQVVEPPADFYSSRNYTDSLLKFIDKNQPDNKPFFAFYSFTAPHDPLHVPKEWVDKYKGKFDMGWDSLRALRLNNLKALGIFPKDLKDLGLNPAIPKWASLPPKMRAHLAQEMEIYASMVEYVDMSIGRVFDYLKSKGMYDNTMIIFMSDNGANGAVATSYPGNGDGKYLAKFNNSHENMGLINSYPEMGPGWAQAVSAPFRFFKSFTTEGGIRAPLIIKMPGQMKNAGEWNNSFIHVTDIMPTVLALAGANYPSENNGKKIKPLIGKSMLPVIKGDSTSIHTNEGMGWELFEMKAYLKGDWKILRLPQPFGTGKWQLFDIKADPGETADLSAKFPEIKEGLIKEWDVYAKKNEVYDHNGHFDSIYRKNYKPKDDD